ncbi:uracil-xanthine permease family protein [Desulfurispira natronophila]|uniref:Uracil permease n=1 Tax=Desulfurispira natronophila TaxID=682562 RepID=A0A7W7Y4V2_9BACT|nr:uracil permease [Desulfurispira natronophila]
METLSPVRRTLTGVQMLFVAFGALVLVPLLTGLDPSVALFTAGVGTIAFQIITRRKVPIFLASSFAYIAPIIVATELYGVAGTLGGLLAAGVVQILLSIAVRIKGDEFIHKYLPAIVVGPVIMLIGLILAPVAVNMAQGLTGDGSAVLIPLPQAITIAMVSLVTTVVATLWGRGMLRFIPILIGVISGYVVALVMGVVDFDPVREAAWLAVPAFTAPEFHLGAILFMIPVVVAPTIEHVGDMIAISRVTGKNYLHDPGLKNTLLGDGTATSIAALFGGPPNTTYSEVTGAVALLRVFDTVVMTIAAITAIVLAFVGKLGAVLLTIPVPVMGGIMILLFGMITSIGIGTLVRAKTDMAAPRNMIIVAVILVLGIGGMALEIGQLHLGGLGLAGLVGVVLNIILPKDVGATSEEP